MESKTFNWPLPISFSSIKSSLSGSQNESIALPALAEVNAGSSRRSGRCSVAPLSRVTAARFDELSRYKAMVKYIHSRVNTHQWFEQIQQGSPQGVALRRSRGNYVTSPEAMDPALLSALNKMKVEVAFTMSTETTKVILSTILPGDTDILLAGGSQLQIVDSLEDIFNSGTGAIKKFQYGALIRKDQMLLIWHDDIDKLIPHAQRLEEKLLALVRMGEIFKRAQLTEIKIWGTYSSPFALANAPIAEIGEVDASQSISSLPTTQGQLCDSTEKIYEAEENGSPVGESLSRSLVFNSAISTGLGAGVMIVLTVGLGTSMLIDEALTDGSWLRFVLIASEPFCIVFGMFFGIVCIGNIFQVFGPISSLKSNSRFYSSVKPNVSQAYNLGFAPPHITIQMPVYKESLTHVIMPTIQSLKVAISHYESRGGSASIFVNDDGLALLGEQEANDRIDYYHDNNIGWVSRPKDGQKGYSRRGRFKKASNMNFALNTSCNVEEILQQSISERMTDEKSFMIHIQEEESFYQHALEQVIAADPHVRAKGNVRIGEFILIVDSDTRVPEDCLIYGAAEMFLSPEVAIIQHSTGVMQVSCDYFENGIAFFTSMIYTAIRFAVGSGEAAPFVGHNAFLRWRAIQSVGRKEAGGYIAYWSESHVSEDFDMALRLQHAGNIVRFATYHANQFLEGVSLTIYDELARWEKYAFGCNELVFHPVYTWLWRGPFTRLFLSFLVSNIQLSSKLTILGYIVSYYALASSFPMTVMNYFIVGWFNGSLDKFYLDSWTLLLSVVLIFAVVGPVCLALLRYRLGEKSLWRSLLENFKWMPMFAFFFGGLSYHLNLAILAHMFGVNMQWGSTAKEIENSNFFKEVPKIARCFKWMYLVLFVLIGGMIYLGCFAPRGWEIETIIAVAPLAITLGCHFCVPFVLNPSIMIFNY